MSCYLDAAPTQLLLLGKHNFSYLSRLCLYWHKSCQNTNLICHYILARCLVIKENDKIINNTELNIFSKTVRARRERLQ